MKLSFIKAFTLAEALITLGIIGVISTITIPNLISTYRVKIIESRLKSTFSILSQSIKLAEAEHEECTGWDQVYSGATYVYPFMKKYFLPFVKYANEGIGTNISCPFDNNFAPYFQLMNGTTICLHRGNAMDIWIDINGMVNQISLDLTNFVST